MSAPVLAQRQVRPSRMANLLLLTIAAVVVVALIWASVSRLDTVTRGQGRVIPSMQLQRVANLEGGMVRAILVRAGERVAKGQVLVRLDSTQVRADLGRGAAGRDSIAARIARLEAELAGRPPTFAPALVRAAPTQVETERALWRARRSELEAALSAGRAKLVEGKRTLSEAEANTATRADARTYAERDLAMIAPLVSHGVEPEAEGLRADAALAQARGQEAAARAAQGRARAGVEEARADLRSVVERYRSMTGDALAQARADFASAGPSLPALSDRVARTDVRAPIAGTVNRVLVNTVGGVVRPGDPLVEIVPTEDRLVIETRVSPRDIGFIHPGQTATVKLTAYDYAVYGGLSGVVERVSPDAVVEEAAKESFYTVRVATRDRLRDGAGKTLPIVPGMIAEVDVIGQSRTVMSYLLTPLDRVRETAMRER